MAATEPQPQSAKAFSQVLADMALWLTLIFLFVAFRAILAFIFRDELVPRPTFAAWLRLFETGARSDTCVAMWAVLPSLILTLAGFFRPLGKWHGRIRGLTVAIALSLCAIVFIADVGYFAEYGNQFDHRLFGLIYDDTRAILTTVWKSYPLVRLVLFGGIAVALLAWLIDKLCRVATASQVPAFLGTKFARALIFAVIVLWIVVGARIWPRSHLATVKNAIGTGHEFLNKVVLNPFFALRYTIWQERKMHKIAGLRTILPNGDVRSAATALFPNTQSAANLDDCLKRTAPGPAGPPPTHIFLVVMESYDAWATQPDYATLHLTDRVNALGSEGIHVRAFLPAGGGTMASLGPIISGVPAAGVLVNYQPAVRRGVPTAIAGIFKQLGYKTRYFLGASLRWERSGEFCREQGFDEIYGGDQMPRHSGGNEWGIDDEDLFRFVLEHTGAEPTFNLIMTSSFHAPYSVDLAKKGFDLNAFRANPLCAKLSEEQARILGHLWYSDKCVGDFVPEAEQKLERPLFAITGDHYSRKQFVSARPMHTMFEHLAVPLVLYGRKALEKVRSPSALAGSHLDILPTIVDLTAPAGFVYHTFGRDLFDTTREQIGFGCDAVVGPDLIFRIQDPSRVQDLQGRDIHRDDAKALALKYRQLQALGWWRAIRGNRWPAEERSSAPTAGRD